MVKSSVQKRASGQWQWWWWWWWAGVSSDNLRNAANILVIIRTCSVHTASAKNSCLTGPLKRPILLLVCLWHQFVRLDSIFVTSDKSVCFWLFLLFSSIILFWFPPGSCLGLCSILLKTLTIYFSGCGQFIKSVDSSFSVPRYIFLFDQINFKFSDFCSKTKKWWSRKNLPPTFFSVV